MGQAGQPQCSCLCETVSTSERAGAARQQERAQDHRGDGHSRRRRDDSGNPSGLRCGIASGAFAPYFFRALLPPSHASYNWQLVLFFCSAAILDPFLVFFELFSEIGINEYGISVHSASQPSLSLLGCYRNSSLNFYISCGGHDGGLCSMGVGSGFVSA